MKVYGTDLLRQYNKLKELEASLNAQIKKRNQYLIKNAGDDVLDKTILNLKYDDADPLKLINQIIAIEKAYADKTVQGDMFNEPE